MAKRKQKGDGWRGRAPSGFGARLRALRTSAGLTQGQLADRAGIHRVTVAKLEAGTQEPAWPLVCALAEALGILVDEFRLKTTGQADPPAD